MMSFKHAMIGFQSSPSHNGSSKRNSSITFNACVVSMFVYIDVASAVNKSAFLSTMGGRASLKDLELSLKDWFELIVNHYTDPLKVTTAYTYYWSCFYWCFVYFKE